jgi:hypothetical protein
MMIGLSIASSCMIIRSNQKAVSGHADENLQYHSGLPRSSFSDLAGFEIRL